MNFYWDNYNSEYSDIVDSWLDNDAKSLMGFDEDEKWNDFYEYWVCSDEMKLGENYWCKIVFQDGYPFAFITLASYNNEYTIMEVVVDPQKRGLGLGSSALKELCQNGYDIIGKQIHCAKAVIYPNNTVSQKAFEKAGFVFEAAHPDSDAWYYKYTKEVGL